MAKNVISARKRGRPSREESTAIAIEKAVQDTRLELARLSPKAIKTLEGLLDSGTEKVKETTSKYILEQTKEAYGIYIEEDNEGSHTEESVAHDNSSDNIKNMIPLTTKIREYKIAEGED